MSTSSSSIFMYGYVSERDSSSRISASQTTFDFAPFAPLSTCEQPAVAGAAAVLRDRLRRDHRRRVRRDVDALAARVLMLALAGERDRQHLAVRALAHQPDRRVLHRQLRAEVPVDPLHRRVLVGDGALRDEVVDVVRPVLDRRVAAAAAVLDDDLDDRASAASRSSRSARCSPRRSARTRPRRRGSACARTGPCSRR